MDFQRVISRVLLAHEGHSVEGVRRLQGDASSRTYYRVQMGDKKVIAMKLADDPLKSDEVVDGERPRNIPFLEVRDYLSRGGIPVPEVLYEDLERGVILLEDLGDRTVERALNDGLEKEPLYRRAISLMCKMHAYAAKNPDPSCICFRRRFGEGLLRWEMDHFYEWGLLALTGRTPTPGEQEVFQRFRDDLVRRLTSLPQGFVHRDFQSRNLMLHNGSLYLIDFQDALLGPYVYDLVSLLRDSYVLFQPEEVEHFITVFASERASLGLPCPSKETLLEHFHLQALQRKLKDAGRFVYIDRVKKNPKFLPNIPRSLAYAREAFTFLGCYNDALEVLARYLPEHFG